VTSQAIRRIRVALAYEFGGFTHLSKSLVAAIQMKRTNRIGKQVKTKVMASMEPYRPSILCHHLGFNPIVAREWMVQMGLMTDMRKQQQQLTKMIATSFYLLHHWPYKFPTVATKT
jgi:hypothetical protein